MTISDEMVSLLRDMRTPLAVQAADEIDRLRTERDAAMRLLRPFADAVGDLHEQAFDEDNLWESPAAMSLTAGDLRRTLEFLGLMGTDVPRQDGEAGAS